QLKKDKEDVTLITSDEILRRYAEIMGLKPYALSGQSSNLSLMNSGSHFLIATMLPDSSLRNNLKVEGVKTTDTIKPYVLQLYTVKKQDSLSK
ncbi:MAG TPA: hypothetical protein VI385_03410, partial [Flavisolibacter sp.]